MRASKATGETQTGHSIRHGRKSREGRMRGGERGMARMDTGYIALSGTSAAGNVSGGSGVGTKRDMGAIENRVPFAGVEGKTLWIPTQTERGGGP